MIIKSMSRKEPSFGQLIDYITSKACDARTIMQNFSATFTTTPDDIRQRFEENAKVLRKWKNGNVLYHEIVSEKLRDNISLEQQKNALHDIATKYAQQRAPELLVFGQMHLEDEHLHYHLVLSANPARKSKRFYFSRAEFSKIQRDMEAYSHQKYPEITQDVLYNSYANPNHKFHPEGKKRLKQGEREKQLKTRTQRPSKKDELRTKLKVALEQAQNLEQLRETLEGQGITLYMRGKTIGAQYGKMKSRLRTLGLEEEYQRVQSLPRMPEPEITPPEKQPAPKQEREPEVVPEPEQESRGGEPEKEKKKTQTQERMEELEKIREQQEEPEKEQEDDDLSFRL